MELLRHCLLEACRAPKFFLRAEIIEAVQRGGITLKVSYDGLTPSPLTPRGTHVAESPILENLTPEDIDAMVALLRVVALQESRPITFCVDTLTHGVLKMGPEAFAPTRSVRPTGDNLSGLAIAVYPNGSPGIHAVWVDVHGIPLAETEAPVTLPLTHTLSPAVRHLVVVARKELHNASTVLSALLSVVPPVVCPRHHADSLRFAPMISASMAAIVRRSHSAAFRDRCLSLLGVVGIEDIEAALNQRFENVLSSNSQ